MKKRILIPLLVLTLVLAPASKVTAQGNDEEEAIRLINEIAPRYNLSPEFVQAVAFYESSYRADVVSSQGCVGLLQINPKVHAHTMREYEVTDLTDMEANIALGCDYLLWLFEQYQDPYEVLMVYNQGNSGVTDFEAGKYSSYAKKICEYAARLTEENER